MEFLKTKKVIHVAVGALHCLAVTDAGQVHYKWILIYLINYSDCSHYSSSSILYYENEEKNIFISHKIYV